MRVVFLGTPEFAVPSLDALYEHAEVVGAVCQPDRERDRKGRIIEGAVKRRAEELGIPVYQFEKIRRDGVETLRALAPDVMITCAYGQILSQEILDIAPLGVLNVHGSVLPKYRGSAPIQRALINGEKKTGVTIMKTDIGMDTGAILSMKELEINGDDYVGDLYEKLSCVGADLLIKTLDGYLSGEIIPVPQNDALATQAPPLKKEEAYLDFTRSAESVRNVIRGFGYGVCEFRDEQLKIYRAEAIDDCGENTAGTVVTAVKHDFIVACGSGALAISELQACGKKRMKTADFLNGVHVMPGEILRKFGGNR
ncbi:MAG TPA: methionyl-tRNA formyltransferase [Clostridiales bacterium]|nr:methionyl-tRNA formyltransferase [Clostridiales bacterium]